MNKSLVLDRNTWKHTNVCKLFVLTMNTWNHITVGQQISRQKCNYKTEGWYAIKQI